MLEDLNNLAKIAKQKCDNYDKKEFLFSSEFKLKYSEVLKNEEITFYDYTSIVKTSTSLIIIVPNQWFVIASFFIEYLTALKVYKSKVVELRIDKDTINNIRNNKTIDSITEEKINTHFVDNVSKERFIKFLNDYDWWHGSKTIDRTDFYVSPILSLASVINNSQSYISEITNLLSDNIELSSILSKDYNNYEIENLSKKTIVKLQDKKLRTILNNTFKFILKNFGEEKVLEGFEIKDSKIEERPYKGLTLPKYFGFEVLIGMFNEAQNSETLKSSGTLRFIDDEISVNNNTHSYFTSQWNEKNGRGLSLVNFNHLLNDISNNTLEIINDNGIFKLIQKINSKTNSLLKETKQTIYYGAPGTGKSYKVDNEIKNLDTKFYERVTFHPEYDNASFVGGYKPVSDKDENGNDFIKYKFIPQAFTNIYERAWLDENNQYYLVIEEINRGNCAEIFGDIFQLLDRNSNYTVSPSVELKKHLIEKLGNENHEGIAKGLRLPPNLTIYATMNTSDQSLFPMDSAFKRRWEWEYVPINYEEYNNHDEPNESYQYKVFLDDEKVRYFNWIDFIKNVNLKIEANENLGMDKCIGNYFIKSDTREITIHEFVNKVIFYLWNDVFKDEQDSVFEKGITFEKFFPIKKNALPLIEKLLSKIDVPILPKAE
jgi:hypothetical protein